MTPETCNFSKIHIAVYKDYLTSFEVYKILHLKYQSKMIGVFLCIPRRFSTSHFYNNTANAPHITAPSILLTSQDLNRQDTKNEIYASKCLHSKSFRSKPQHLNKQVYSD